MRIIIACAGRVDDPKWRNYLGVPKHLAPVNGKPLLHRTVAQVRERTRAHSDDVVVTISDGDERYRIDRVGCATVNGTNEYSSTRALWSKLDRTILLLGDVYWTDAAIDTVLRHRGSDPTWFGRYGRSRRTASRWGEIFGATWTPKDNARIAEHLDRVDATPEITRPPGWKLYRSLHGLPMGRHRLNGGWVEIDDETDDFDTPETYRRHPAIRATPGRRYASTRR